MIHIWDAENMGVVQSIELGISTVPVWGRRPEGILKSHQAEVDGESLQCWF